MENRDSIYQVKVDFLIKKIYVAPNNRIVSCIENQDNFPNTILSSHKETLKIPQIQLHETKQHYRKSTLVFLMQ